MKNQIRSSQNKDCGYDKGDSAPTSTMASISEWEIVVRGQGGQTGGICRAESL